MNRLAPCLFSLCFLGVGCAHHAHGPDHPVMGVSPDGSPRWVRRGSGTYDNPHGKAFYGVGLVQGIDNPSLSRQTAGNRARGELGKLFNSYVASLMKDYQRHTSAGGPGNAEEQDVVSAQKTISEVTLRGAEVRDFWTDPESGVLYALAVLNANTITDAVGKAQLSPNMRDWVRANAERAFDDLDQQLKSRDAAPPPPAEGAAAPPPAPSSPGLPPRSTESSGKTRVGLRITGIDRATVQTCFAERLLSAGYEVFESTKDIDVMVTGELIYKRAGLNNGAHMVKAHANIRAQAMDSGATLVAVNEQLKVGRPTLNEAIQLAVSRLCDRVAPRIVNQIRGAVK